MQQALYPATPSSSTFPRCLSHVHLSCPHPIPTLSRAAQQLDALTHVHKSLSLRVVQLELYGPAAGGQCSDMSTQTPTGGWSDPYLVEHFNKGVCMRQHLELQALAGYPERLLSDCFEGSYQVFIVRRQQLQTRTKQKQGAWRGSRQGHDMIKMTVLQHCSVAW